MSVSPPSSVCHFDSLPPELVLEIIGHLGLGDIAAFAATSKAITNLIRESEQAVFRTAGFRLGLADPQSAGSTAAVAAPPAPNEAQRRRDELNAVVKQQQSISGYYDGVQSWKDFVRRAHTLKLAWRRGTPTDSAVKLEQGSWFGDHGLHRFKLETETKHIITTAEEGGLQVFDMHGNLVWHNTAPAHPYPHIEASGGYLTISHGRDDNHFLVYRRADITEPPSQLTPQQTERIQATTRTEPGHATPYLPFALIDPGTPCMATKLRMPYFAAVAAGQTHVLVCHLLDHSRQKVDISSLGDPDGLADARINYVELFQDHVLLAGSHSVSAWNRAAPGAVGLFPPRSRSAVINASAALQANSPGFWRNYGRRAAKWSAVHHDGANVVAVSHGARLPQDGRLMWTVRPGTGPGGALEVAPERTAVLRLHATCVQLAVENGRAVVATVHNDLFCALWLVDLTARYERGTLSPTAPKLLCFPLPCVVSPSRVEMTSGKCPARPHQIFFPATSALAPGGAFRAEYERLRGLARGFRLAWEWYSLDGVELGAAPRGRMVEESGEFAQGWMQLMDDVDGAGAGTDVVGVLDFGGR